MTTYDHSYMCDLLQSGKTAREVANLVGCNYGTVSYVARKYGITLRGRPKTPKQVVEAPTLLSQATGLLQAGGKSHKQIATELGCSVSTVNGAACVLKGSRPSKVSPAETRRYRYGITDAEYAQFLDKQGGRCAICKAVPDSERARDKCLFVDHCHTTEAVRGLLCHSCNAGLGALGDSQSSLTRAIGHLRGVLWAGDKVLPLGVPTSVLDLPDALDPSDLEGLAEAYHKGASISHICSRTGKTRSWVYSRLKEARVVFRSRGASPPVVQPDNQTTRKCAACRSIAPLNHFRRFGLRLSYYCKQCYYEHYWVPYKYGLPPQVYRQARTALGNKCPILLQPFGSTRPVVDHCHETGVIRGLISRQANMGLGLFSDDQKLLLTAREYLDAS